MKKGLILAGISLLAVSSILSADTVPTRNIYIDIDSDTGKKILESEVKYKAYLQREAVQDGKIGINKNVSEENACEIAKLKKALVKMIRAKGYIDRELESRAMSNIKSAPKVNEVVVESKSNSEEIIDLPTLVLTDSADQSEPIIKKNCVDKKYLDTSSISKSYYSFDKDKEFRVTYNVAGTFNLPVLGIDREKLLKKGTTFKADMYTKAGWVHIKNGNWVKGYKLYPRMLNHTTNEDKQKWASKYITKTICK